MGSLLGVLKFLNSGWLKFYCLSNSNASSVYTNLCTVLTSDEKSILLNCLMVYVHIHTLEKVHIEMPSNYSTCLFVMASQACTNIGHITIEVVHIEKH